MGHCQSADIDRPEEAQAKREAYREAWFGCRGRRRSRSGATPHHATRRQPHRHEPPQARGGPGVAPDNHASEKGWIVLPRKNVRSQFALHRRLRMVDKNARAIHGRQRLFVTMNASRDPDGSLPNSAIFSFLPRLGFSQRNSLTVHSHDTRICVIDWLFSFFLRPTVEVELLVEETSSESPRCPSACFPTDRLKPRLSILPNQGQLEGPAPGKRIHHGTHEPIHHCRQRWAVPYMGHKISGARRHGHKKQAIVYVCQWVFGLIVESIAWPRHHLQQGRTPLKRRNIRPEK